MNTTARSRRLPALAGTIILFTLLATATPSRADALGGFADDPLADAILHAPAALAWQQNVDARWLPTAAASASLVGPQSAAFAPSGTVYDWGNYSYGQLGNNSTTNSTSPVMVLPNSRAGFTNTGVTAIAAGGDQSLAVENGRLFAWGENSDGQLGNNSTGDSGVPVPVPNANGFFNGQIIAVAAGNFHSMAVGAGAVYAWGSNFNGQLGNNSTTDSHVPVPVSSANGFTNTDVTAIAAGDFHSLALQGGVVYAWGNNSVGQLGNSSTTQSSVPVAVSSANGFTNTGVTAIAAGEAHTLAIRNGAVYAWGFNGYGQLGNNSTANSAVPVAVLTLYTGVTSIAAGEYHSLAVKNGNVFAWGQNDVGELGNGTETDSHKPVEVSFGGSFLSGIVQVAAGLGSSYALAGDGSLYVWGDNSYGQLGIGNTMFPSLTPQHVLPPDGQYYQLIDSDSNGNHILAILGDTPPVPEPGTWALLGIGAARWPSPPCATGCARPARKHGRPVRQTTPA